MKAFEPSNWNLSRQIAAAMAKCDASVEQVAARKEAREEARAVRGWTAEAEARRRKRLYGIAA